MSAVEGSHTGSLGSCWAKLVTAVVALVIATPTVAHADPPGDVEHRLNAASDRLEKVVERFDATRADLARTRARVRAVTRQLRPLDQRLDVAQDRVSHIAVTAYKDGRLVGATA